MGRSGNLTAECTASERSERAGQPLTWTQHVHPGVHLFVPGQVQIRQPSLAELKWDIDGWRHIEHVQVRVHVDEFVDEYPDPSSHRTPRFE